MSRRPKIVILGMLTKIPVAGAIWQNLHYLVGLRRLGFDVYYVEAHARTPTMFMEHADDDASLLAARFLDRLLRRFDFGDRWAFHALHDDGRSYGLSLSALRRLYREAELIVNLHGATVPLPEHTETGRLVYLETDPVELQIELYDGRPEAVDFAAAHKAFATWGLNYGGDDCLVPLPEGGSWLAAPPPVLLDLWPGAEGPGGAFTTVGNWRQYGEVHYRGERYTWSKHDEFLKFVDLPRRTGQRFELALGASSFTDEDRLLLEEHGWHVRSAAELSADLDEYRRFVAASRAEFTVAKDQNVRLRSGWFSERSAVYLASGRPVITQDTGFGTYLPTGEGLLAFSNVDEAAAAVEAVGGDYEQHRRAARELAREFLDADRVLPRLLDFFGLDVPAAARRRALLRTRLLANRAEPQAARRNGDAIGTRQEYREMVRRLRSVVDATLPVQTTIAVVSKGDRELLRLGPRRALHFPQTESGSYAGHYPADSAHAVAHLDSLRGRGLNYLVFPETASWWLDYYGDFCRHLETSGRLVLSVPGTCRIYALDPSAPPIEVLDLEASGSDVCNLADLDETGLRLELADVLLTAGSADAASELLREGLDVAPNEPRLLAAAMRCEDALGNARAAAGYAGAAVAAAGDDAAANLVVGRYAREGGRLVLAEQVLTRAVERCPAQSVARAELLRVLCERVESSGETDDALVERFVAACARYGDPRDLEPELLLRIVEALTLAGRNPEALEQLGSVLEHVPFEDPAIHELAAQLITPADVPSDRRSLAVLLTRAGNAYAATRDDFRAEASWRLAHCASPSEPPPAFNLAWSVMAAGRPSEALEHLAGVRRIYPDETSMICWPAREGRPWPYASFGGGFEELKPVGTSWPRITVITPSLNHGDYLEETILSVLNQEYPDLEYIVVDGGSTDGSKEILRRYEHRLGHLIVEPDDGQSDAINKGLRLATGELVTWINSDDLLAPGALFVAAARYLATGADLIAGFCCEHSKGRFGIVNLPAVTPETFTVEHLGDLFEYWLKGHFFYQPEVVISRRILDLVGRRLRDDLKYTMDFELWLRCAAAGAAVSVVPWPIALFRKHERQKTHDLDPVIVEQARVRDEFIVQAPSPQRAHEIRRRFRRALGRPVTRMGIVSSRAHRFFSPDTGRDLAEALAAEGCDAWFAESLDLEHARTSDLLVLLLHLRREHEALRKLRESGSDVPVIGWAWDNHHHVFENHRAAADVDVLVPGHAFAAQYLRSSRYVLGDPLPLCVTQWTSGEAARLFETYGHGPRYEELHGGFVRYPVAASRNALVEGLQAAGVAGIEFVEDDEHAAYFGLSPEERFARWAAHKASLCLPLRGDLSIRFFDALLTGQIPIVMPDVHDLDLVVPPRVQAALPVIRCDAYTVASVRQAYAEALRRFDEEGIDGARRRHEYVLGQHMFVHRIRQLVRRHREGLDGTKAPSRRRALASLKGDR